MHLPGNRIKGNIKYPASLPTVLPSSCVAIELADSADATNIILRRTNIGFQGLNTDKDNKYVVDVTGKNATLWDTTKLQLSAYFYHGWCPDICSGFETSDVTGLYYVDRHEIDFTKLRKDDVKGPTLEFKTGN